MSTNIRQVLNYGLFRSIRRFHFDRNQVMMSDVHLRSTYDRFHAEIVSPSAMRRKMEDLGNRGQWKRAIELLNSIRDSQEGLKTTSVFNGTMAALSQNGRWKEALDLLELMRCKGVGPDRFTYSSVIIACAKCKQWRSAVSIMQDMVAAGLKPDSLACSTFMSTCAAVDQWDEAVNFLEKMIDLQLQPSLQMFQNTLNMFSNRGEWEISLKLLEYMEMNLVCPNEECFSSIVRACSKHGQHHEVSVILSKMNSLNITPSLETYHSAIEAYEKSCLFEKALHLFDEMLTSDTQPHLDTFSRIFKKMKFQNDEKSAVQLLKYVESIGIQLRMFIFQGAIKSCDTEETHAESLDILKFIHEKNLLPDKECYAHVIHNYITAKNWRMVLEIFKKVEKPNYDCFRGALLACQNGGFSKESIQIFNDMKGICARDVEIYRYVINAVSFENPSSSSIRHIADDIYRDGIRARILRHWQKKNVFLHSIMHSPKMAACAVRMVLDGICDIKKSSPDKYIHNPLNELNIICKGESVVEQEELQFEVESLLQKKKLEFLKREQGSHFIVLPGSLTSLMKRRHRLEKYVKQ